MNIRVNALGIIVNSIEIGATSFGFGAIKKIAAVSRARIAQGGRQPSPRTTVRLRVN